MKDLYKELGYLFNGLDFCLHNLRDNKKCEAHIYRFIYAAMQKNCLKKDYKWLWGSEDTGSVIADKADNIQDWSVDLLNEFKLKKADKYIGNNDRMAWKFIDLIVFRYCVTQLDKDTKEKNKVKDNVAGHPRVVSLDDIKERGLDIPGDFESMDELLSSRDGSTKQAHLEELSVEIVLNMKNSAIRTYARMGFVLYMTKLKEMTCQEISAMEEYKALCKETSKKDPESLYRLCRKDIKRGEARVKQLMAEMGVSNG